MACIPVQSTWPSCVSLGGVLHGTPTGYSVVLLGDFKVQMGNGSETGKDVTERNGLPDLIPSGLCASHAWVVNDD